MSESSEPVTDNGSPGSLYRKTSPNARMFTAPTPSGVPAHHAQRSTAAHRKIEPQPLPGIQGSDGVELAQWPRGGARCRSGLGGVWLEERSIEDLVDAKLATGNHDGSG